MKQAEIEELHYIAPIENVPSILTNGIYSNIMARKVKHQSCASEDVQNRRKKVILPNGKRLHDYANVYFNARNPMMYLLKEKHNELTVLSINPDIINLPGVIITDQNASRDYVLFKQAPGGLTMVDRDMVFAESWVHQDPIDQHKHKGTMCAEVLIPNFIENKYIQKAYVSCDESLKSFNIKLSGRKLSLPVSINPKLFFG